MDKLRREAREALQKNPSVSPEFLSAAFDATAKNGLRELWDDLASHDGTTHMDVCVNLCTACCFIDCWSPLLPDESGPRKLDQNEVQAVCNLFQWASEVALPSSEFVTAFDESIEVTKGICKSQDESRFRSVLAIQLILQLTSKVPDGLPDRSLVSSPDVVLAVASFSSENDPWTTTDSLDNASMYLSVTFQTGAWNTIERVLKEKIKPLFTKTENPAITNEGRKNLHPVPLTRFDGSTLDDESKPWKNRDIYATRVLYWIVSQYKPVDKVHLERHFPLLVPAMLALIDDNNVAFKRLGCEIFSQILESINKSGSDILTRTNLTSVFEDAITPCLLSLPTITPEDSSLMLLGAAYPALLSLYKTAYHMPTPKKSKELLEREKETFSSKLTNILRSNLISSFHHISSSTPAAISTSATFPYPQLSTYLLELIGIFVENIGIHTTKYLQDLVPVLYTTLSNPFGAAHLPLLLAAASTTKLIVLNAHPRIWRWRGEILGALCACWLTVASERKEKSESATKLVDLSRELQSAALALKHALQNPVAVQNDKPDADQLLAKDSLEQELKALVNADNELEVLLFANVKSEIV